jgi:hypothetical protein
MKKTQGGSQGISIGLLVGGYHYPGGLMQEGVKFLN